MLNAEFIPGVRVYPTKFEPSSSHFAGKTIEGVRFVITNREAFDSVRLGLEVAVALQKLYPGKIDLEKCQWLIGNQRVIDQIRAGTDPQAIQRSMSDEVAKFVNGRKLYLLY